MLPLGRFAALTGQRWKYGVSQAATVAAGIGTIAFLSLWSGNPAHLPAGLTMAIYFVIGIFAFVWWSAAVRCPSCGVRIGWYHMNRGSASDAWARIDATAMCPACGFDPAVTGGRRRTSAGHERLGGQAVRPGCLTSRCTDERRRAKGIESSD